MGIFSKSEAELKQIAADLDKRQAELDNREIDLKSSQKKVDYERQLLASDKNQFETNRANHLEEVRRIGDSIAAEKADLEKRRNEVALMESKAKANFADAQREAFAETFEKRQVELDNRQKNLNEIAADVQKRLEGLHAKEGELAAREFSVTEREQKADAGFADKIKVLADEASHQHQANQTEALRLKELADNLASNRQSIENEKLVLLKREQAIVAAEQKRDAGYTVERSSLDDELRNKRIKMETEITEFHENKLLALEDEIAKLKTKRLEDVAKAEQAERERIRAEIAREREAWLKEQEDARKQLNAERTELERLKGAVAAQQSETEQRKAELESAEKILERKEERLERQWQKKNDELDNKLESLLEEERKSLESENQSYKDDNARLRESLRVQTGLFGAFEQLKRQLGDKDPAEYIRELASKTDEIKRLREELAIRPTEEMRERFTLLETEAERQKARADEAEKQIAANNAAVKETAGLLRRNSELEAENKSLAHKASIFEGEANEANAKLKHLLAPYEKTEDEQKIKKAVKKIKSPIFEMDKAQKPDKAKNDIDEIAWLEEIGKKSDSYGIHFNQRILYAFHTALKTAEWSPLTILAGVSGTGKSELPRLYSHFGGIFFEPLSVQSNWDSQESMLGFFNSIDNEFDAQPVLRFLAQSQEKWVEKSDDKEGYPGLEDAVCLVLLDEMNLAHPELYFAEFLSKLELRRGMKGSEEVSLPVKIGAGMPPYLLPLGRNVLWTGTMNQDETTKSLSDKVLDRSIIIHFPRPTKLKSREELKNLKDHEFSSLPLHRKNWENWWEKDVSNIKENVALYKEYIEKMNTYLAVAGRAIGHRVWQSIEYYMANYPEVRAVNVKKGDTRFKLDAAMHKAFEDQLVQKVMPKLRGIDTRGKSRTECLDKILGLINIGIDGKPFNLTEDFNIACELGYGQFMWQTANYIKDEPTADNSDKETNK